eukprot:1147065-Pelagomonas_calceolata.AAC.8
MIDMASYGEEWWEGASPLEILQQCMKDPRCKGKIRTSILDPLVLSTFPVIPQLKPPRVWILAHPALRKPQAELKLQPFDFSGLNTDMGLI